MEAIPAPPWTEPAGPDFLDPGPSADGLVELDTRGRLVRFNRRLLEIYGLGDEQIREIVEPKDRARLQEGLIAALAERSSDPETFRAGVRRQLSSLLEVTFEDIPLRDGRVVERYGTPVRGPHGELRGRLFTIRDVSERRRGETELRERARQQEAVAIVGELALNTPGVASLLPSATHISASALDADCVHVLALTPDGAGLEQRGSAGRVCDLDVSGPLDASASAAAHAISIGATVVTGDVEREGRFRAPPGAEGLRSGVSAVIRGRSAPFGALCAHWRSPRTPSLDEVHFLETVANILSAAVARDEAERALMERERELRAVFEATQDGLVTLDDEGRVVSGNPAACTTLGLSCRELAGRPLFSRFLRGVEHDGDRALRGLLTTGRGSGSWVLRGAGRAPRTVEWTGVARILPGRHLVVMRDVTEQRELHARLALADRMASVGTLAAGVAHELNNPLAYVGANLSYAIERLQGEDGAPGADLREALEEAREGAARMREIVRDLRAFSRADEMPAGPVELRSVLETCLSMAANEIKHRARLTRDFADVPPCRATEARLAQVFLNLVVNAAQAIPVGAADEHEIRLSTRLAPDGRVAVEVRDSGRGIRAEDLPRIFDPFFTTKAPGEGTGLGLSICHRIVADLGGEIAVESDPGRGTCFRVLLPTFRDLPAPERPEPARPPDVARARVLVVDDEPLVGAALQRALSAEHDVTVLSSARAALDLLSGGETFDAILTDLLMPEMTGMDLFQELSTRRHRLADRVLFTTGGAFTSAAREFVARHPGRCLEKPFDLDALREAVRQRIHAGQAGPC